MRVQVLDCYDQPSIGTIFGNIASSDLLQGINTVLNEGIQNTYHKMGAIIEQGRKRFFDRIVAPRLANIAKVRVDLFSDTSTIQPITEVDDLYSVSPQMHLPILLYEPVRELLNQGRIDGWGYDPSTLPKEDIYGRLINNGKVEDLLNNLTKQENGTYTYEYTSTYDFHDPVLTYSELDAIEDTREFLDELLQTTRIDPTNPGQIRG